jgi:hypothetical protein
MVNCHTKGSLLNEMIRDTRWMYIIYNIISITCFVVLQDFLDGFYTLSNPAKEDCPTEKHLLTIDVLLILKSSGGYCFMRAKHIIAPFRGFFLTDQ